MGVIDAQGVLLSGQVVAQHQVQLIVLAAAAGNGGDGVVGLAVGLGQDQGLLVGVAAPGGEDVVGQVDEPLGISTGQAHHRHGPLHDAGLYVLIAGEGEGGLYGSLGHSEGVPAALEVVVGQDGAAHDGQVGVGAHEVVGELTHKVQELTEAGLVNFHGGVLAVEADAVLVVVHIGGVLQEPGRAVDGDGHDAVVLTGGVVHPAGIALILRAQLAAGIGGGGQVPGSGNGLGVLLGFGQVDGDVQLAVLGGSLPLHVLGNAVPADVIGVLAELIVPVGGLLGVFRTQSLELLNDLGRAGSESAHDLGVKQVAVDDGVLLHHATLVSVVHQLVQHGGQVHLTHFLAGGGVAVQLQHLQQGVQSPQLLTGLDQLFFQSIGQQFFNGVVDHN